MFKRCMYYAGIILLNLTGLGLGFLFLRRWQRWRSHILMTAALFALAVMLKAYQMPAVWLTVGAAWVILSVVEGCLLARGADSETTGVQVFLLGAAACFGIVWGGLLFEGEVVDSYHTGMYAYQQGDCQTVLDRFIPFNDIYRLSLNPLVDSVTAPIEQCRLFIFARQAGENGYDMLALNALAQLHTTGPQALPAAVIQNEAVAVCRSAALRLAVQGNYEQGIQGLLAAGGIELQDNQKTALRDEAAQMTIAWGDQVYSRGEFQQATHIFEQVLTQFADTAQVNLARKHQLNAYLALADANYRQGNLEGALSVYLYLKQQYNGEADAQPPLGRLAELYTRLAADAYNKMDYPNAVKNYETLQTMDGTGTPAMDLHLKLAKIYLEWASDLRKQGQFEQVVIIYQKLVKDYADTTAANYAGEQIPFVRLAWVDDLYVNNQFDLALNQLEQMKKDYPNPPMSNHVAEKYPEVYLAWGQYLFTQKQYAESIEKYGLVKNYSRDVNVLARAQQGINQAQNASGG